MANQNFPIDATGTLSVNWTVAHNYSINHPAATELVKLANTAGQIGNVAATNMCATGVGAGTAPCAKLHTIGGNITQWNGDYAGQCTLVNPTGCAVYTFIATYNAAPKCTATLSSGTLTGILRAATTTTQLTITSSVTTDTGVINWSCNPDAQ